MSDDMLKLLSKMTMDYSLAIDSTKEFEKTIDGLDKELTRLQENAVRTAKGIGNALNSGMGSKQAKDMFSTDEIEKTMMSFAKSVDSMGASVGDINQVEKAMEGLADSVNHVGDAQDSLNKLNEKTSWFVDATKFHYLRKSAKEAVDTIEEVEAGMISIQRVMSDSSFVFDDYRDKLLRFGVDYGQSFANVQDVAMRWVQAGYNVADSLDLTETSLIALNAAELNVQSATQGLIAIMAQWNLEASDLIGVIDKINITADNYAVSSQDLVDGLVRSSSAAKNFGMELEDTIALLTVMREASGRTGQEVGNALNSILSYMQRAASIKVFEGMGIQVFADEAKTEFRNVMLILEDLSRNWDGASDAIKDGFVAAADEAGLLNEEMAIGIGMQEEWNDLQKRDLSQAAAGVFRRNYFIGLINRMVESQEILNGMMDAGGYSADKNAQAMEGLGKKMQSLKTSVEQLAVAVGDSGLVDVLKSLVDAGTGALNLFNKLPDEIQKPILAVATMYASFKSLDFILNKFGHEGLVRKSMTDLAGGINLATLAGEGFGLTIGGWVTILAVALPLLHKLYQYMTSFDERAMKKIESSKISIDTYKEEVGQLRDLADEYEKINSKVDLSEAEKSRLLEVQRSLAKSFPELITGFDEEGNAIAENMKAVEGLIESKQALLDHEVEAMNSLANAQLPKLEEELGQVESRIEEISKKLKAGDTDEDVWTSRRDGILETKDATGDLINELEGLIGKQAGLKTSINELIKYIKYNDEYLFLLTATLDEARKKLGMLTDAELVEIATLKSLTAETSASYRARLGMDRDFTQTMLNNTRTRLSALRSEIVAMQSISGMKVGNVSVVSRKYSDDEMSSVNILQQTTMAAKNTLIDSLREEMNLGHNLKRIDDALSNVGKLSPSSSGVGGSSGGGSSSSGSKSGIKGGSSGGGSLDYENKELERALKLLEHRKKLSEETFVTIKAELDELRRINKEYVRTEEERMDMAERIYATEKRLKDATLQHSINWINEQKSLGKLSAEEEIKAWERVKSKQIDNINAVKQATVELYKLRSQVMAEAYDKEDAYIKHLTKLGLVSVEEQIAKYRDLYREKAKDYKEEWARTENLFDLYKREIEDQQRVVRDAYDERIERIEEEARVKKDIHQAEIEAINKELDLLNRQEDEYNHDKKMAGLREQLAYWQVRTSEDARKKVADLTEQIAEEERKRELELYRQGLEDKKKNLEDEVRAVDDKAREERDKLEKSYKQIEVAFDSHSINLIALASTMSKGMFGEFEENYLKPLERALASGDYGLASDIVGGIGGFAQNAIDSTYNSSNAQVNRLANQILDLKRQYEYGQDKSAADRAKGLYDELSKLNPSVANTLHLSNYEQAKKYIEGLPTMHSGGKTLSYGAVYMKPGELVFPPDLSIKLERLIAMFNQKPLSQNPTSTTDNRKEFKIDKLLNIENNYMKDQVDENSLSSELARQLSYIFRGLASVFVLLNRMCLILDRWKMTRRWC